VSEFDFFGEKFRLRPTADCQVAMLDFAELASGDVDETSLQGLAAVKRFLRDVVVAEDFDTFWKSARANHAKVGDHLMPIIVQVFRGETARPTGRSSDSSDGPTSTPESSAPDSFRTDSPPEPVKLRAVQRLEDEGRPDKALIVQMAVDSQGSAASA
jgi:hypothetical protein